jgi:hypothetical protein
MTVSPPRLFARQAIPAIAPDEHLRHDADAILARRRLGKMCGWPSKTAGSDLGKQAGQTQGFLCNMGAMYTGNTGPKTPATAAPVPVKPQKPTLILGAGTDMNGANLNQKLDQMPGMSAKPGTNAARLVSTRKAQPRQTGVR